MRKSIFIVLGVVVLAIAWYLFRPELLFIEKEINEEFPTAAVGPASSRTVLASGRFHGVAHETRGSATLYQLADGKRVLRFTEFETSNGPDVQVYLVAAPDASDNTTVTEAGFVSLGALKGTTGDQNYEVPADVDLNTYRAVTVWCRRFGVNFATAPLSPSSNGTVVLASGRFHGVAHETRGTATVYELAGGKRVLRFTEFETSNGPDVQVYLVAAPDASDNETVTEAGFIALGALKGTTGDQNYDLPPDVDLDKYQSVTVWCRRFGVNFATAPLQRKQG